MEVGWAVLMITKQRRLLSVEQASPVLQEDKALYNEKWLEFYSIIPSQSIFLPSSLLVHRPTNIYDYYQIL